MTNLEKFDWNQEHIITHRLSESVIAAAGIGKLDDSEIFVEHPEYKKYYVSQYGRVISLKRNGVKLLGAFIGGQPDRQYMYYGFTQDGETKTIGMHRAVADTFCPNFWKNKHLEAHHIDGDKMNNNYRNLILLTTELHSAIHKIKKIVLLEDILLANKGKKKPVKSRGKFTVFDIKGHLIGFQYYPEKDQKKKK